MHSIDVGFCFVLLITLLNVNGVVVWILEEAKGTGYNDWPNLIRVVSNEESCISSGTNNTASGIFANWSQSICLYRIEWKRKLKFFLKFHKFFLFSNLCSRWKFDFMSRRKALKKAFSFFFFSSFCTSVKWQKNVFKFQQQRSRIQKNNFFYCTVFCWIFHFNFSLEPRFISFFFFFWKKVTRVEESLWMKYCLLIMRSFRKK